MPKSNSDAQDSQALITKSMDNKLVSAKQSKVCIGSVEYYPKGYQFKTKNCAEETAKGECHGAKAHTSSAKKVVPPPPTRYEAVAYYPPGYACMLAASLNDDPTNPFESPFFP